MDLGRIWDLGGGFISFKGGHCTGCSNHVKRISPWLEQDANSYIKQIFFLNVPLIVLTQVVLRLLLRPLGQTPSTAQMLVVIIISLLKSYWPASFTQIFPKECTQILDQIGRFGYMFYIFLVGLKMDVSIVVRSSKTERLVGILTFIIPIAFTVPLAFIIPPSSFPGETSNMFWPEQMYPIAWIGSTTSFHVITCFLTDLKLINTELGHIAFSASAISGLCNWITVEIVFSAAGNSLDDIKGWFILISSTIAQVIFITLVLRNIVMWIIKQTPQGEPIKQMHISSILFMILLTGFLSEVSGRQCYFGPMILGLAIPNGPPVASALEHKLDALISGLFMPVYSASIGSKIHFWDDNGKKSFFIVAFFSLLALLGRLIATIIPCILCKLPFRDAFMLGLILSNLGIFDFTNYDRAFSLEGIDVTSFLALCCSATLISGVISPLVHLLYNPSANYIVYNQRCIQNVHGELCLLVCVYNEDNVPTILNILEASHPCKDSPIALYILHLIELCGRSTPLMITHKPNDGLMEKSNMSKHIINSFNIYGKQNQGHVTVQQFTSITALVSAHDDICKIALDKRTSFIVIPFHEQRSIDGITQISPYKNVNINVLNNAPCSVGILIENRKLKCSTFIFPTYSSYNIGVIFLGGADDREALCYAMRMAGHPHIHLTVHRIIPATKMNHNVVEKILDGDVINQYRVSNMDTKHNLYNEVIIDDGVQIISLIRTMANSYELILVGRCQDSYSALLTGLSEWNEYPELGCFGDLFASSDIVRNASILVVQQHRIHKK